MIFIHSPSLLNTEFNLEELYLSFNADSSMSLGH